MTVDETNFPKQNLTMDGLVPALVSTADKDKANNSTETGRVSPLSLTPHNSPKHTKSLCKTMDGKLLMEGELPSGDVKTMHTTTGSSDVPNDQKASSTVANNSNNNCGNSDDNGNGKASKKPPLIKNRKSNGQAPYIAAAEPPPAKGEVSDRVRLGICAMDKKARSKPMAEILSRLDETLFHVIFFGDDLISEKPIEEWPVCQVLVAFYSKGYPLAKAKEYVKLRRPFILNDLDMQEMLKDRRKVYDLLEASGIDVPRHVYLSQDGYVSTGTGDGDRSRDREVKEFDDHIEVNGMTIHKPFVEKPVDADDHNIAIYYPSSAGGGCKKLFRKIGNRSSEFYPEINEVRRDGSYIYEEFVETQGTDVKMYTVGPEYGHAEARKSPTVDGKVQRDSDGKEVRFPVILTLGEKEIARRIVLGFKQFVCGFDLLRVQEGHSVVSYVCDVNGWSFVKNSRKYYDDCAQILTEHMLAAVRPKSLKAFSTLDPMITTSNNVEDDNSFGGFFPLRPAATLSNVARLLQRDSSREKSPTTKREQSPTGTLTPDRSESGAQSAATTLEDGAVPVRELPHDLISEPASLVPSSASSVEDAPTRRASAAGMKRTNSYASTGAHQEELRCVIAVIRHGDRTPKQKLKVNMTEPQILQYFQQHCEDPTKDLKVKAKAPMTQFLETVKKILANLDAKKHEQNKSPCKKLYTQLSHMRDVLERWKITGLNRKLQIKPRKWEEDEQTGVKTCTEVQLILKWGGNLTKLGENQAIKLGQRLRYEMYPDAPGGGILRLHSTFRHDLKIKTSDEGRVMKTAAAFAKGLLELEGEIPPILVSLVHKEKGSMHMLDPSGDKEVKLELDEGKEKITANLQQNIDYREMTEADRERMVGPPELTSVRDALAEVGNPRRMLMDIHRTMGHLIDELEEMLGLMGSGDETRIEGGEGLKGKHDEDVALSGVKLYKGETLLELTERWRFIYKNLYDPDEDRFDLSRIPDVHDNVRFDVLHNPHLGLSNTLEKLYEQAKSMADCVVPQEYGTTISEKRSVGVKICSSLLEKLCYDLSIARTDNKADMRYMINMDYSADLPINTMGRRIRTRLYFTSESHLHTMLNVLRFAKCDGCRPILSPHGTEIINTTRELCYLTQIIIRLFEDTDRLMEDPRRFRVEILFSPGATATPLHMHESSREADTTRLDTSPLQPVSIDGLTCQEVEQFFHAAIVEGSKNVDDRLDVASASTTEFMKRPSTNDYTIPIPMQPQQQQQREQQRQTPPSKVKLVKVVNTAKDSTSAVVQERVREDDELTDTALSKDMTIYSQDNKSIASSYSHNNDYSYSYSHNQIPPTVIAASTTSSVPNQGDLQGPIVVVDGSGGSGGGGGGGEGSSDRRKNDSKGDDSGKIVVKSRGEPNDFGTVDNANGDGKSNGRSNDNGDDNKKNDNDESEKKQYGKTIPSSKSSSSLFFGLTSYQLFWSSISIGTLLLGAGCIFMALSLSDGGGTGTNNSKSNRRRLTRR